MTPDSRIYSILRGVSRRLPVLRRLYARLFEDHIRLKSLAKELSETKSELVLSRERALRPFHELSLLRTELAAANVREVRISQELSISKAEFVESNDRESRVSRELMLVKAELAAAVDREQQLAHKLSIAEAFGSAPNDGADDTRSQVLGTT
jgi:hypothetical protein